MFSFNLVDEPWIPCRLIGGNPQSITLLDLQDAFRLSPSIQAIAGENPLVTISIHRLLLAILHRVLAGPRNADEWGMLKKADCWDEAKLLEYLQRWKSRFDLFDEQYPFYQTPGLDFSREMSVARLRMDNFNTLFDHTFDDAPPELSPAEAARLLIAYQSFDTGGIKTGDTGRDFADSSPLLQSAVCLVRGQNLFQTLLFNLHHYSAEDGEPFSFDPNKDKPSWERDETVRPADRFPEGYLDLLTWQSRRLRLHPQLQADGKVIISRAVLMKGYQFPDDFTRSNKETMVAFRKRLKAETIASAWATVGFEPGKSLWRDSQALFQSISDQRERPKMLTWLYDLSANGFLNRTQILPVEFFGLTADQAKLLFWRHETLPVTLEYLGSKTLIQQLGLALSLADKVAEQLRLAQRLLGAKLLSSSENRKPLGSDITAITEHLASEPIYWSQLETYFKQLLTDLPNDQSQDEEGETVYGVCVLAEWARVLKRTAEDAFQIATRSLDGSSRALKAVAIAQNSFNHKLRDVLKTYLETNNQTELTGGQQ